MMDMELLGSPLFRAGFILLFFTYLVLWIGAALFFTQVNAVYLYDGVLGTYVYE